MFCAQKICGGCKQPQPTKKILQKRLSKFDSRREVWAAGVKINHNVAALHNDAILLLEKLQAVGYKPTLLLAKGHKKPFKCEALTPRSILNECSKDCMSNIKEVYAVLCEGWTEDSQDTQSPLTSDLCANPEQGPVFTLTLVPVNPQETSTSLTAAPRVETSTSLTPSPRVETSTSLTPAPRVETLKKKRQRKPDSRTQQKKQKKECLYHTSLKVFPIRSVIKERVRKGISEIFVDWQPCPVCGEEWPKSWQPKATIQPVTSI
ncbi:uncharacterized protein LOC124465367 [Hypomesus transpacificus]|uniref:uncharacterized protein LOC124465367 n=1 Tax=Hypomesus transpacificus TaxID=137520 RepID=UPI001F07B4D0|nr:uncharacterized protein LOC124465367 [Hypomesus transpacificus]